NDTRPNDYRGWGTYLDVSSFRDSECARETGRYELVRNWRLGIELAGERPFTLVNLATSFTATERTTLARLRIAFGTSSNRRFRLRNWASVCSAVLLPEWFERYAARRGLCVQSPKRT